MKYFRNTSWLFAEKRLRMIVGLFVGIWMARYLGPEQFGLFSYAQSFVGLLLLSGWMVSWCESWSKTHPEEMSLSLDGKGK